MVCIAECFYCLTSLDAALHCGFLQSPWIWDSLALRTTSSRKNIPPGNVGNQQLVQEPQVLKPGEASRDKEGCRSGLSKPAMITKSFAIGSWPEIACEFLGTFDKMHFAGRWGTGRGGVPKPDAEMGRCVGDGGRCALGALEHLPYSGNW